MKLQKLVFLFSLIVFLAISCENEKKPAANSESTAEGKTEKIESKEATNKVFTSPLGKKLTVATPSEKMMELYGKAKQDFSKKPQDLENTIWLGRRTAYLGKYEEAINIYSAGLKVFPNEPRLYRHRGHRYISIRKFDEAIADFEKATQLIEGKENQIEQDGLPNKLNMPISTLHGNIWYHLGLAYYLKHDFEKAFSAYQNCRKVGSNDDNIVSSTHWLFMIQSRLGNHDLAKAQLKPIRDSMNIIENHSYFQLCKFYKKMIPMKDLMQADGTPAGDAVKYGIANWNFYNGDGEQAKLDLEKILAGKAWSSFGYIAAEADYLKSFFQEKREE
jgi:tetratricopeptide (TPR) repeat protein